MVLILYFFWGYTLNKLVYLSKPKQAIFELIQSRNFRKKKGQSQGAGPKGVLRGYGILLS
jgi:hypothetical protein